MPTVRHLQKRCWSGTALSVRQSKFSEFPAITPAIVRIFTKRTSGFSFIRLRYYRNALLSRQPSLSVNAFRARQNASQRLVY
jgi:hypothetical protein